MNSLIARTLLLLLLVASVLCSRVRAADSWQERSTPTLAPRSRHSAVWTGSEMIIWGGFDGSVAFSDGARFNPGTNSWTAVTAAGAPSARNDHSAVWTGTEMIVWGGGTGNPGSRLNTGGRYNPATNSWTAVTTVGALDARFYHTAVWTGTEMIVWGGDNGDVTNTGGRYNPATNSWTATSPLAPTGRTNPRSVWTGAQMILWGGGTSSPFFNDGGRYNPAGNYWTTVSATGAPAGRTGHTAVWTGSDLIVWGGSGIGYSPLNSGGRYNPAADGWTTVPIAGAPTARSDHTAVWTGNEMILWGGVDSTGVVNNGGRYNPAANSWSAVPTARAPTARSGHTAVWTGTEMIVWGGASAYPSSVRFNDTFSYTPDGGVFRITGVVLDGGSLSFSFPTLTGRSYTLWQSDTLEEGTWTDTGLPSINGDGTDKFFSVGAPVIGIPERFYRVQSSP